MKWRFRACTAHRRMRWRPGTQPAPEPWANSRWRFSGSGSNGIFKLTHYRFSDMARLCQLRSGGPLSHYVRHGLDKLGWMGRFLDAVYDPKLKRGAAVVGVGERGEDDHGHVGVGGFEQRETGKHGEIQVENYEIR